MEKKYFEDENFIDNLYHLKSLLQYYSNCFYSYFKILISSYFCWLLQIFKGEKSIEDEVVLITGSGGYLGRHLALEFAKRKATIVLWDINEEQNKKTLRELNANGFTNVHMFTVDITSQDAIKYTAAKVRSKIGNVTMVLMVAAPAFKPKSIMDTNFKEDIELHFKLNYLAQLWLIQEFLQTMINRNSGHFLTVSSNSALIDLPLISGYASFKLAQTKLLETLREELAANGLDGIKTTVAYPTVLTGGIAQGFDDAFEMSHDLFVSGSYAAERITKGVLKNRDVIYIPSVQGILSLFKPLLSGRLLGKFVTINAKINPKYLKLKPRFE